MNPIEVQRNLKGASYPSSADELAALADDNGAPDELVEQLRGLRERTLDGPDDVMRALAS